MEASFLVIFMIAEYLLKYSALVLLSDDDED